MSKGVLIPMHRPPPSLLIEWREEGRGIAKNPTPLLNWLKGRWWEGGITKNPSRIYWIKGGRREGALPKILTFFIG